MTNLLVNIKYHSKTKRRSERRERRIRTWTKKALCTTNTQMARRCTSEVICQTTRSLTDSSTILWLVMTCKYYLNFICFFRYNDSDDDSEDEGIKEYQMGGYHPVHLGEVLINRYVIVQKLGWG